VSGFDADFGPGRDATCSHLEGLPSVTPSSTGCEDCLRVGSTWVHLRLCLECGHVGCCASSPNRHSVVHFQQSGHPVVQSFERGEDWRWCFVDEVYPE